jgi:BlaR1 peptidase M56
MSVQFSMISQAFARQLPVCLLGGTAVVALAWALLRVSARQNAGVRFRVWFSALLATAGLLLLSGVPGNSAAGLLAPASGRALFELPAAWALYGFIAWLGVSSLALLRIAVGAWQVCRLRKSCVEFDSAELDPVLQDALRATSRRRVSLCVSHRVSTPTAIGFLHPAVVMPPWVMADLSTAELKQVFLHELAHLQRWDDWTNLAQKILRALLLFHPLAWWLENKLTLEREMACDDVVLRHTEDANAYARCLATLAEKSFARRTVALAQAAVSRVKQTSLRVSRILHLKAPAETHGWACGVAVVALFGFAGVLVSYTPNLVGFDTPSAPVTAARMLAPANVHSVAHDVVHDVAFISSRAKQQQRHAVLPKVTDVSARVSTPAQAHASVKPYKPHAVDAQHSPAVLQAKYVRGDGGGHEQTRVPAPDSHLGEATYVERAVFVVMRGQMNNAPTVVWQVTVWRATFSPDRAPARSEITPKKT